MPSSWRSYIGRSVGLMLKALTLRARTRGKDRRKLWLFYPLSLLPYLTYPVLLQRYCVLRRYGFSKSVSLLSGVNCSTLLLRRASFVLSPVLSSECRIETNICLSNICPSIIVGYPSINRFYFRDRGEDLVIAELNKRTIIRSGIVNGNQLRESGLPESTPGAKQCLQHCADNVKPDNGIVRRG